MPPEDLYAYPNHHSVDDDEWRAKAFDARIRNVADAKNYSEVWRHARSLAIRVSTTLIAADSALMFLILTKETFSLGPLAICMGFAFAGACTALGVQYYMYRGMAHLARFGFEVAWDGIASSTAYNEHYHFAISNKFFMRGERLTLAATVLTLLAFLAVFTTVAFYR